MFMRLLIVCLSHNLPAAIQSRADVNRNGLQYNTCKDIGPEYSLNIRGVEIFYAVQNSPRNTRSAVISFLIF